MDAFHRSLLGRILAACFLLSGLTAGTGLLVAVIKLDRLAESVALAEVRRLQPGLLRPDPQPAHGADALDEPVRRLVQEGCLLLRVFDSGGRLRLDAVHPVLPLPRPELEAALGRFPDAGKLRIRRLDLLGHPAVQLRMPVAEPQGGGAGRLEAVFLLNPADVRLLKAYVQRMTLTALVAVLATALLLYPLFCGLHRRILRLLEAAVRGNLETALVLGAAITQRDSGTGEHNARVALYSIRLAEGLGEAGVDMVALVLGAFLHDVGKIGIHDAILLKPGPMTDAELEEMRTHVQRGLDIISASRWLHRARSVVQCHHERFDGLGYPDGLRGEAIPLEARIFAIVDVFDALTSARPYHRPMAFEDARALMDGEAGRHFDPVLLAAFWRIARDAYRGLNTASGPDLRTLLMAEVDRHWLALYGSEWAQVQVESR